MSRKSLKETEEKEVQTVIHVYPFILEPSDKHANVSEDKSFSTLLTLEPDRDNEEFYKMLEYCPFHEIEKDNVAVLDLPRKHKITFLLNSKFSPDSLRALSLLDDDGISECCIDLLSRMRTGKALKSYKDGENQTNLMVRSCMRKP
ncbi:uncharacterized protein LOC115880107 [Sitophilus oryzae]|uniref:Uncharacterized protein LOC115880107 n=1 Tax=Sitophilus oryzae TaxID=7048 RepID=A0A6J2XNJ0_SITOR|nr:uncharacterized protein LOC115880107 [Sitophilus oryzae]